MSAWVLYLTLWLNLPCPPPRRPCHCPPGQCRCAAGQCGGADCPSAFFRGK